jgi:hypothetical protein
LVIALPANVDDMDVEYLMQISLVAFTKAKERSRMKTKKKSRVITRAANRVRKLLPSPLTFQGGDDANNLDKALDSFDSLFSSLEKVTIDKVERDILLKKLEEVYKIIEWDKKVLNNLAKEINNCINKGKAL